MRAREAQRWDVMVDVVGVKTEIAAKQLLMAAALGAGGVTGRAARHRRSRVRFGSASVRSAEAVHASIVVEAATSGRIPAREVR